MRARRWTVRARSCAVKAAAGRGEAVLVLAASKANVRPWLAGVLATPSTTPPDRVRLAYGSESIEYPSGGRIRFGVSVGRELTADLVMVDPQILLAVDRPDLLADILGSLKPTPRSMIARPIVWVLAGRVA